MAHLSPYLRRGASALVLIGLGGFAAEYALNVGLSRMLAAHEYGDFKVARAFAILFGSAVLLGGDRAGPRALAGPLARGELGHAWEYLRFYLRISLALSLVVIAGTWLASFLHVGRAHPDHHHAMAWLVLSVPFQAAGALAGRTLQSARRPVLAAVPWRIGLPASLLAAVGFLAWRSDEVELSEVLIVVVGGVLVIAAFQWGLARKLVLPATPREPGAARPRRWLATSLPMMGFFLVTVALAQSDLYFLEALGDEPEVGHYGAAETTAHFVLLIQTSVVGLVAPVLQTAIEAGGEELREMRRRSELLMLAALLPATALLAVAGGPILSLFGEGFRVALPELRLLLLGNLTWAAAALSGLWLQYTGRGTTVVAIAVATLLLDSALNALLIPHYGMAGAAASTAVTSTLAGAALLLAAWAGRAGGEGE